MDDDTINDLKQFIAAQISQQTSDLRGDISGMKVDISGMKEDISGLKVDIKNINQKIDDLSDAVAEAIDSGNDETQKQLDNHETRILKLEQNTA